MLTRDVVIKSRGRKAGFSATKFRHACMGAYENQCRQCKDRIRLSDSEYTKLTKRIEWNKRAIRQMRATGTFDNAASYSGWIQRQGINTVRRCFFAGNDGECKQAGTVALTLTRGRRTRQTEVEK